jgi:hypothetical protein
MQVGFSRAPLVALASTAALLGGSAQASAAPITVNLRVEASTGTVFEGPVTTDAKALTKDATGAHQCDGRNGGASTTAGPTLTTTLDDGSIAGGFTWDATWSASFDDFFINRIGPDTNGGPPAYPSWGYARNYTASQVGGCQEKVQAGDDVLFAYDFFSKLHLLKLTGPAAVATGGPAVVTVTDGQDGSAVAGASVASALAGADGKATVSFSTPGIQRLKATRADSVRSNALDICVHSANDGTCGTSVPGTSVPTGETPAGSVQSTTTQGGRRKPLVRPFVRVRGIRMAQRFSRSNAPQLLQGDVAVGSNGLGSVSLRLWRHHRRGCWYYSGRSERLIRSVCGKRELFSAGDSASWSYLLPFRLPPGHYRLDVLARDRQGHPSRLVPRLSRLSFHVSGGSA